MPASDLVSYHRSHCKQEKPVNNIPTATRRIALPSFNRNSYRKQSFKVIIEPNLRKTVVNLYPYSSYHLPSQILHQPTHSQSKSETTSRPHATCSAGPDVSIRRTTNRSCLAHQLRSFLPNTYVGIAMTAKKIEVPPNTYIICSGPFAATQLLEKLLKP
jgi:hypothetical protein